MLSQYSNLSCMNFDTTNDQEEFISKVYSVCTSLRSFEELGRVYAYLRSNYAVLCIKVFNVFEVQSIPTLSNIGNQI